MAPMTTKRIFCLQFYLALTTEYIKRHNHITNVIIMEYVNDFKTQTLNDIFFRHSTEPVTMKNNDQIHQGISIYRSFSPAPKSK
jgi:hypothetical protein